MLRFARLASLVTASLILFAAPVRAANFSYALPVNIDVAYGATKDAPHDANPYDLTDRRADTAAPVGKWLRYDFLGLRVVTGLVIVNGDGRPGMYEANARVRTLRVEYPGGQTRVVDLADTRTPQTIPLDPVQTRELKLVVEDVYPGARSGMPYLSTARILGYDPSRQQVRLSGRFTGCGAGFQEDMAYCRSFVTDQGESYGCSDDQCYHPVADTQGRVTVIGVVQEGKRLEVLEARPAGN